jgi:predicted nucleotidyltransferase
LTYDATLADSTRSRSVPLVIDEHRSEIDGLCQRFGVARLDIFGSVVGDAFDVEHNDVDLLVEFIDPAASSHADDYFGLKEALEAVFGRRVDLITRPSVRNPYLLGRIEATRELVFSR